MERYSYKDYSAQKIEDIVRQLVWKYPSHGFVIDLEEATRIGLKAERLDAECNSKCRELLDCVKGCIGFVETATTTNIPAPAAPENRNEGQESSDGHAIAAQTGR